MFSKNLIILTSCQALILCSMSMSGLIASLVGFDLAPIESLGTLPISAIILGNAVNVFGAVWVLKKLGRKYGSIVGAAMTLSAAVFSIVSLYHQSFTFFCLSQFLLGLSLSFVHQYRFAAAECVRPSEVPKAISFLLIGSIFAAFLGPQIGVSMKHLLPFAPYAGGYLITGSLSLIAGGILLLFKPIEFNNSDITGKIRSLSEILKQKTTRIAIVGGTIGYSVMTFIMTATPISMHKFSGYSLASTKLVIQCHIIAMFLPSLITGTLIQRLGPMVIFWIGICCYIGCIIVGLFPTYFHVYLIELILLGVAWNFVFISATSLLTSSYSVSERFKIQALNDMIIFSGQFIAAFLAGFLINKLTWAQLNIGIGIFIVSVGILLIALSHKEKFRLQP
ncbi:MFS transporter [bacterium]|jgi:MFS family permease|nr:MFS transporter [bacterium]